MKLLKLISSLAMLNILFKMYVTLMCFKEEQKDTTGLQLLNFTFFCFIESWFGAMYYFPFHFPFQFGKFTGVLFEIAMCI